MEHFKARTQIGHVSAVADHSTSTDHNIKYHFEILASGQCVPLNKGYEGSGKEIATTLKKNSLLSLSWSIYFFNFRLIDIYIYIYIRRSWTVSDSAKERKYFPVGMKCDSI